jgi:hypothetical protein
VNNTVEIKMRVHGQRKRATCFMTT